MAKAPILEKVVLTGHDDIFRSTETTSVPDKQSGEQVIEVPLTELYPPEFHPFQVNDDEAMYDLAENIKEHGIITPGLARPHIDANGNQDGYELLIGNRRKRGSELAERNTMRD